MLATLSRRLDRLEASGGGRCPVCRGARVQILRTAGPPPRPCAYCGALPVQIRLQRVPARQP